MTKITNLSLAAMLATALMVLGLTTAPAGASTLAGCVTPGGDIKNVGFDEPSKPCGRNDTLVVWEEAEPASECPCEIRDMASWAGWHGPSCDADDTTLVFRVLVASNDDSSPLARVSDDVTQGATCRTDNDRGTTVEVDDLEPDEVEACFADIDKLAHSLGLPGGCAID
jgi:hypothetical protein